ncbi:MAG TPA: DUF3710 domain-containing protein [Pseudonocardiaceae bacterium]
MFGRGRHRRKRGGRAVEDVELTENEVVDEGPLTGPFDESQARDDGVGRLDLGCMRLPLPDGAQLQVEVDPSGPVRAVHLLTELGQLTVTAFAAPRDGQLWTEVRAEITDQLRADGARVEQVFDGEWGREVQAVTPQVSLRFVGVDGPRWMLRGVAAGVPEQHPRLVELLYQVLRDTVVVRGAEPMPPRSPLPITLPGPMAEQLKLAAAQQGQQPPPTG